MLVRFGSAITLLILGSGLATAQAPPPAIVPGWELDTTTAPGPVDPQRAAVLEVWAVWRDYLTARMGGKERPDLWLESERTRWPNYDLSGQQAYQSFERMAVTVLNIRPAGPEVRDTMVIRTLFSRMTTDSSTRAVMVRPVSLTRVYAVKTSKGWRLSNAVLHLTAGWQRITQGPLTFLYSPSMAPDQSRREAAARFVDSLTYAFSLPPTPDLLYLVTSSAEEAYRIAGMDFAVTSDVTAGWSDFVNHLVVSGDPRFGEAYFHELAHMVFTPLKPPTYFLNEGLAIWAGGTLGHSYRQVREEYVRFLREHPDVTLDQVIEAKAPGDIRLGAALLCDLVFQSGGVGAIRTLVLLGHQGNLRKAVEAATGGTWQQFAALWHAQGGGAERNAPVRPEAPIRRRRGFGSRG